MPRHTTYSSYISQLHRQDKIYRTIPHIMHDYEGKLHTPTSLIYGSESNVVSQLDLRYMKKFYAVNIFESQGTHMFPMEFPEETAQLIMQIVDSIEQ